MAPRHQKSFPRAALTEPVSVVSPPWSVSRQACASATMVLPGSSSGWPTPLACSHACAFDAFVTAVTREFAAPVQAALQRLSGSGCAASNRWRGLP